MKRQSRTFGEEGLPDFGNIDVAKTRQPHEAKADAKSKQRKDLDKRTDRRRVVE
jgi:hypothetical protein